MRNLLMLAAGVAATALAGCSNDSAPTAAPETATPVTLAAGEYEVATKVEDLRSTDYTTPATKAKLTPTGAAPALHRACVASDGSIAPEMFSEAGDSCKIENSYVRSGKINLQLTCSRSASPGQVLQSVAGNFTGEGFTATVNTGTYFVGDGDYAMRRSMTAKRVGNCPPGGAKKA